MAQYRQARDETANCSTGRGDHSKLSECSSAATPPLCSPGSGLSVQMNSPVSACPPAKLFSENPKYQRQRGSSKDGAKSLSPCICMDNSLHVSLFGVLSLSLTRLVHSEESHFSLLL